MCPTQLLVPVYEEGEGIRALCAELRRHSVPYDSLKFIFDFEEDSTVPVIRELQAEDARIVGELNGFEHGVLHALRWGFSRAGPGPVITIMGDNSDKISLIPEMIALWESGSTIVSPSRYMPGGRQSGGGLLKSTLSRLAGVSLKWLGFPTSDPTNNFKLYDGEWLRKQKIESTGGFEVALELCHKAFLQGARIAELPTEWRDRTSGESHFRLLAWLPAYLRWYLLTLRALLSGTRARTSARDD